MLDKKIFFENIKLFLLVFNFSFEKETDLKLYCTVCYDVFIDNFITTEEFIKGVQYAIKNTSKANLYGRPAPLDLYKLMHFDNLNKPEIKASNEYYKILIRLNTTIHETFDPITTEFIEINGGLKSVKEKFIENKDKDEFEKLFISFWLEKFNLLESKKIK